MAQKKAKAPEPAGESAPMWIVSFADLVTLLMSFFVVLYALKQGGEKQQMEVSAAIKSAFDPNYIPPADATSSWDVAVRRAHGLPGPPLQNMGGNAPSPTDGAEGRDRQVKTIRAGRQIVTGAPITFEVGSVALDEASMRAIKQIAESRRGMKNILEIKGHISADEVGLRADDPDGMKLSFERAMKVREELVKMGVDAGVLEPKQAGANEPVKTGVYDAAGLRVNRRVEVFTTDTTASDFFPIQTVPAAGRGAAEERKAPAEEGVRGGPGERPRSPAESQPGRGH